MIHHFHYGEVNCDIVSHVSQENEQRVSKFFRIDYFEDSLHLNNSEKLISGIKVLHVGCFSF